MEVWQRAGAFRCVCSVNDDAPREGIYTQAVGSEFPALPSLLIRLQSRVKRAGRRTLGDFRTVSPRSLVNQLRLKDSKLSLAL